LLPNENKERGEEDEKKKSGLSVPRGVVVVKEQDKKSRKSKEGKT
jgi:hypothetical protein